MQPQPTVSIVLATFNGQDYLGFQIDSILNQSHSALEIIIVDDHSTDRTWPIVLDYAKRDSRIKAFRNETNLGYIKNFEKGISLSSAKYVALSDQDDVWKEQKIELLLKNLQDADLCYCDSELIDEKGNSLNRKLSDLKNLAAYKNCLPFAIGNCIAGHAILAKREMLVSAMPFPNDIVHDWWLAFYFSCAGNITYLDKALVLHRQHTKNTIAAINTKGRKRKKEKEEVRLKKIRERLKVFHETSQWYNVTEKEVIQDIYKSYQSFSSRNNILRSFTFLTHREELLATKKRSAFRNILFCFKLFFTLI
jgi:glycosyltransferase involved in cell wall biosynthesis